MTKATKNKQVLLASRPVGAPKQSDFRIVEADIPEPREGEVLVKNLWLSLDPYMRGRMSDAKSYAPPIEIGAVMVGGTIGEVVASRDAALAVGDAVVVNALGWQEYGVVPAKELKKVDRDKVPLSAYLGVVGMPGATAWYGLYDIGQPKAGETVVVSAAAGAVGGIVGQLAKLRGCRVVGVAGGKEKCDHVVRDLGFDACVDYRDPALEAKFAEATPNGIDVYFDNVAGPLLDLVLTRVNKFARIPFCGFASQYNATERYGLENYHAIVYDRVRIEGFLILDVLDRWPAMLAELAELVAGGHIKYKETIAEGIDNAPSAFIGMLEGKNLGKQLVRLA